MDRPVPVPSSVTDHELVAVVAQLGIDRLDVAEAVGGALGRPDVVGVLATWPGVALGEDHLRVGSEVEVGVPARRLVEIGGAAAATILGSEGRLEDLGRLAVAASLVDVMRDAVRAALRTQPPLVGADVLRTWLRSGVLALDDPHARWLVTACRAVGRGADPEVVAGFEAVRQAFQATGHVEAEISAGLAAAVHARRIDDLATMARLAQRSEELVVAGHEEAMAAFVLGQAIRHQIFGEPAAALDALDAFPPDRFDGDWAAQVAMIRGTNLMLLERHEDAIDALTVATGHGSEWSYAVALELRATARWHAGDPAGAIEDLSRSAQVATEVGAVAAAHLAVAHRSVLTAALGHEERRGAVRSEPWMAARRVGGMPGGEELDRLHQLAHILRLIGRGDLDGARERVDQVAVPARTVRSAPWVVALRAALLPDDPSLEPLVDLHGTLATPLAAGRRAADHLAGGPPVPSGFRAVLPATWCEPAPPRVELMLVGDAVVRIDGRPVQHADWNRARVRELCLHMAIFPTTAREVVAARLWPEHDTAAAKHNLRVTLSYLMNVLAPGGPKTAALALVDDRAGMLGLADEGLWVDVRAVGDAAERVRVGVSTGDVATLVQGARELVRLPRGDLLGGALPPWADAYDEARREAEAQAATIGAPRLAELAHHGLAEALARRGLEDDRWAERLHQVVVRARLERDDLDGARRALRRCFAALAEIGVSPELETLDLARRLGGPVPVEVRRPVAGG